MSEDITFPSSKTDWSKPEIVVVYDAAAPVVDEGEDGAVIDTDVASNELPELFVCIWRDAIEASESSLEQWRKLRPSDPPRPSAPTTDTTGRHEPT